ncbi:uncharacterized protein LOC119085470 [Bradysia coprophila]|uniref:uncharacterized protein LOC119085470 n=1 Tax=Bradysia coprophila TaxID=38358 RepID=UPI00187DAB47|nr:uncharacterized protein LOC119085470 [Bradysia coprophila]
MEIVEEVSPIIECQLPMQAQLNQNDFDDRVCEENVGCDTHECGMTVDRSEKSSSSKVVEQARKIIESNAEMLTLNQPNSNRETEQMGERYAVQNSINNQKPHKFNDQSSVSVKDQNKPKPSGAYDPVARKLRYLTERNKSLAKKLKESQSANIKSKVKKKIDSVLKTLSTEVPAAQFDFIKLQLKNTGKAKKGNRFTFEEKMLALVIYKQIPKRYQGLRKICNLPTRQTLIVHSATVRFKQGINQNLMSFIKEAVSKMEQLDKLCTVGWDEMSLTSSHHFDQIKDYIDGFEDTESKRTDNFATHALVFMARGITSAFKQPISYFLTANLNSTELAELVLLVTSAVMDTGLNVIGSVCDAVNTNLAAVNKLMGVKPKQSTTGQLLEYYINGCKIWHFFDPPHLIKSVRNNLLLKNLLHTVSFNEAKFRTDGTINWNYKSKQQKTASWIDVSDFFKFNNDCESGLFNLIPNVTDEHITPTRRKMKVSLATQVFSGTCGRNMYICWKRKQFKNNCIGTAAVLLFFNELFDSVNGDVTPIPDQLKGSVTMTSNHFTFWGYAIRMLDGMKFTENLTTGKPNQSHVCQHWISSLKGLRCISKHLLELGVESIGLRRLNQDGLENHFF